MRLEVEDQARQGPPGSVMGLFWEPRSPGMLQGWGSPGGGHFMGRKEAGLVSFKHC